MASIVRDALQRRVPLEELVEAHPDLGEPALALLEPGVAVTRRRTPGGAGPEPVKVQLDRFRTRIEVDKRRLEDASAGAARGPRRPNFLPVTRVVDRSFYDADSLDVAPRVLNKLLARRNRRGRVLISGRIVEVEAYRGEDDPASHAYKGLTRRNATMFGPPGRLYVYFTYGMHWCANLVCAPEGLARAVLLRALAPVEGIAAMRSARGEHLADRDLLSGPARLCQAMGIDGTCDGADLVNGEEGLVLLDDGVAAPERPATSGRVGIRNAADVEWRWWVAGDPNVSKARVSNAGDSKGSVTRAGDSKGSVSRGRLSQPPRDPL